MIRIGSGYDVHRFTKGRDLILGGVKIDYHLGLLGHSDADVLIHAICDALLGAAALGDIGFHFPDSNPKYKNIYSIKLLKEVYKLISEKGFKVVNIDTTIFAECPKLAPYRDKICEKLSSILNIDKDRINIKATTTEKLGFVGQKEGIVAQCTALIEGIV